MARKFPHVEGRRIETVQLPSASPGTNRQLDIIHYGTSDQGPKAYLQAALHADEIPGLLVIHQLRQMLDKASQASQISGHIVLAPIANPVGNAQFLLGELAGRYELGSGTNFNRDYPDLVEQVAQKIAQKLDSDVETNTDLIRDATQQILTEKKPLEEAAMLKQVLMANSIDADIVLDLHCDFESVMHLYTSSLQWPDASDLAAYLGAEVVLLAKESGGHPFDESLSNLWWQLADRFPDKQINNKACLAATIELRGKADVEENQARLDALALYHFLQARGVIAGKPPQPTKLINDATPLDGVEKIVAPIAAVVSYHKSPGDRVLPGDVVCTLFDISEYESEKSRIEIAATVAGVMYSRRCDRLTRPGQILCRIAGKDSIPGKKGPLLEN